MGGAGSKPQQAPQAASTASDESKCPVRRKQAAQGDTCPVRYKNPNVYNVYGEKLDPTNLMPATAQQLPSPGQDKPLSTNRVVSGIAKGGTDSTWVYPSPQMFYNGAQLFPESLRGWFMTRLSEEELLVQGPSVFSPVVAQQQPLWNSHCMPHLGAARPGTFVVPAWQRHIVLAIDGSAGTLSGTPSRLSLAVGNTSLLYVNTV